MKIISNCLYPVNKSNDALKTNLNSNQNTQITQPESKLIMPDSALLKVSFTGSVFSKIGDFFSTENDLNPEHKKFIIENKIISPKEKIIKFKEIYGDRLEGCPNDTQIPKKWGGITLDDIKPEANLSYKNLIGFDFVKNNKTDILGINLNQALLYKAILNGAQISDNQKSAKLSGAILDKAELNDAILNKALLKAAKLDKAQLNRAKLNDVNLYLTEMNRAELVEAELNNAYGFYTKFINADLTGAKLTNANMFRPDLTGAALIRTDLKGTRLDEAELKLANFQGAWLGDTDLKNCININSAKFEGAYYNNNTKFPDEFNFEDHNMIFVPKSEEEEFYKDFKKIPKGNI
ncbi:MAG: pentapeptide repeat-containing protein [Candidatus Gastranaerophilales bacterium]|nr:pentapeptide repeat-containing protein [Candidatus Gastranaerophilales bacterium]